MKKLFDSSKKIQHPKRIIVFFIFCGLLAAAEHSLKIEHVTYPKLILHAGSTTIALAALFIFFSRSILALVIFSLFLFGDLVARASYDAPMTVTVWMSLLNSSKEEILASTIENFHIIVAFSLLIATVIWSIPRSLGRKATFIIAISSLSYVVAPSFLSYPALFETKGYQTHIRQSRALRTPEYIINLEHVVQDIAWRFPVLESLIGVTHSISHLPSFWATNSNTAWSGVTTSKNSPNLMVLVIGESLRADHLQIYGYDRQTTPNLTAMGRKLEIHPNTYSAGATTWTSLPVTLALDHKTTEADLSIVTLAQAAGYKVHWISNQQPYETWGLTVTKIASQADNAIFLSKNAKHQQLDGVILPEFSSLLGTFNPEEKHFVVLHMYGSHLTFSERYPPEFEYFKTEDYSSSIPSNVSDYDNSILYTDYILTKIIQQVENQGGSFLFTVDHGLANKKSAIPLKHDIRDNLEIDSLHVPLLSAGLNKDAIGKRNTYSLYKFPCLFSEWTGITADQLNESDLCHTDNQPNVISYIATDLTLRSADIPN